MLLYVKWLNGRVFSKSTILELSDMENCPSMTIDTVGHQISQTNDAILVAQSIYDKNTESEKFNGVIQIPKIAIIEKKRLEVFAEPTSKTQGLDGA